MEQRRRARRSGLVGVAIVAAAGVLAACGGNDDSSSPTTPPTEVTTHASTRPAPEPSVAPDPPAPVETSAPATTVEEFPTTTEPTLLAVCEDQLDETLAAVDASIAGARLVPGGDWSTDTDGAVFDDRTTDADEFTYRLGLDCPLRAVQTTADGAGRLVVGAWTGERRAWVVQATDGPSMPYAQDIRFQLFIDQPYGEWIEEQAVWVGSMNTGETVIVGTDDTAAALAAKAWWNEVPRFEDLEVTIDSERYAIDALMQAGARNVSVADPANFGTELAAVQFITPKGLVLIGTVAPPDWFDASALLFEGEQTVEQVGGVDVYVTTGAPDAYATASVGWVCGEYVWYIDSVYGTVEELTDWAATVIESTGC